VRYLPWKPEYPGRKTLTYIDLEYLTPIMVEIYGWDDDHLLTCRYVSRNVKFNVGLTKDDFLP
jgi:outer membrane lipoprotein-sorting protein